VQQVWIEALRKRHRARAVRPWLFGVMRNVARTELRRDGNPAAAAPQVRRQSASETPAAQMTAPLRLRTY
jgi:DNA-directed RNA polymerase specialized sigma24 family protein